MDFRKSEKQIGHVVHVLPTSLWSKILIPKSIQNYTALHNVQLEKHIIKTQMFMAK